MVRKLKHHEQKLLRKTDFITYKQDNGHRDHNVIRRYMIQKPEDYNKYNRLCGVSALWSGKSLRLMLSDKIPHSHCDSWPTGSHSCLQTMRSEGSMRSSCWRRSTTWASCPLPLS